MRMYLILSGEEYDCLRQLAWAERRPPRDQAAVLIARALGLATKPGGAEQRCGIQAKAADSKQDDSHSTTLKARSQ